jgi:hypothetical protein
MAGNVKNKMARKHAIVVQRTRSAVPNHLFGVQGFLIEYFSGGMVQGGGHYGRYLYPTCGRIYLDQNQQLEVSSLLGKDQLQYVGQPLYNELGQAPSYGAGTSIGPATFTAFLPLTSAYSVLDFPMFSPLDSLGPLPWLMPQDYYQQYGEYDAATETFTGADEGPGKSGFWRLTTLERRLPEITRILSYTPLQKWLLARDITGACTLNTTIGPIQITGENFSPLDLAYLVNAGYTVHGYDEVTNVSLINYILAEDPREWPNGGLVNPLFVEWQRSHSIPQDLIPILNQYSHNKTLQIQAGPTFLSADGTPITDQTLLSFYEQVTVEYPKSPYSGFGEYYDFLFQGTLMKDPLSVLGKAATP